jgi:hypothetical protein
MLICLTVALLMLPTLVARAGEIDAGEAAAISNWPSPPYWLPRKGNAESPDGSNADPSLAKSALEASPQALAASGAALPFFALNPCRVADTRGNGFSGAFGPPSMPGSAPRDFPIAGQCGIPSNARAVSFNFTVTGTLGPGFLLVYPQGGVLPNVSTLNYLAGQTIANAAIVALGTGGGITAIPGSRLVSLRRIGHRGNGGG